MKYTDKMFEALLFDYDGVLADSLGDTYLAWERAFTQYQLSLNKEKYFALEGKKSAEIVAELLSELGQDQELGTKIIELKNELYAKNHSFSFYPGTDKIVTTINAMPIKKAVVSGGSKKRLLSPPSEALLRTFDLVLTGDDCTLTKPNPDPYLKAAELLGVEPQNCVVIENAPLGIKAAKAANMYCIALTSTLSSDYLEEADLILQDLNEFNEWLQSNFEYRHPEGNLSK